MSKSIFEPVDNIILQAKTYISDFNKNKDIVKEIELLAIELLPQVQKRNEEIKNLLIDLPENPSPDITQKLTDSLKATENIVDNIQLFAEQYWSRENDLRGLDENNARTQESLKKYAAKENMRIINEIGETESFFDLAKYVNQIWVDFDIFEQFAYTDELMLALVRRMNETNVKKTATHFTKNHRKTLEHFRLNLFKNVSWSDEEIKEYINDRETEIYNKSPSQIILNNKFNILLVGMSEALVEKFYKIYIKQDKLIIDWFDIVSASEIAIAEKFSTYDLILVNSYFPKHKLILKLNSFIEEKKIKYFQLSTSNPKTIYSTIKKLV